MWPIWLSNDADDVRTSLISNSRSLRRSDAWLGEISARSSLAKTLKSCSTRLRRLNRDIISNLVDQTENGKLTHRVYGNNQLEIKILIRKMVLIIKCPLA